MKSIILLLLGIIIVPVVAADNVDVSLVKIEPSIVTPGSLFIVTFEARNIQSTDARNVRFELLSSSSLEVEGDEEIEIATIKAGEKTTLSWLVKVRDGASPGFKSMELETDAQSIFVPVQVKSLESTLVVEGFSAIPTQVAPGDQLNLRLDFRNHARFSLKNIKATLDLLTTPFSPINGINEQVIAELDAGERASVSFQLIASPDSEAGTHKIPLALRYVDEFGIQYNQSSLLSATIGSMPTLVVSQDESTLIVGQKGETTIKFVNNGLSKVKLLTVTVTIDGGQLLSSNSVYLGDIDVDDFQTIELELVPRTTSVAALLQFSFRDANNNRFDESIRLPLTVYTAEEAQKIGIIEQSNVLLYGMVALSLIAVYIAYRLFRRRRS